MNTQKNDNDPLVKALDLLGNKWSMLILHNLKLSGPMRFKDCQEAEGMSSRTLTLRLNALEEAGLIVKKEYNEYPPRTEYKITEKGLAITPALDVMTEWSREYL
jgi:DNA-binding HxlR family transcriptional regulator